MADVTTSTPADFTPEPWEPGHCTTLRGGAVHEVNAYYASGEDFEAMVFPLCRTGGMSSRGTTYRKSSADLTCRNCIANRDLRHARQAEEAAQAAPAEEVAPAVEEAPVEASGSMPVTAERMALATEIGARLAVTLTWTYARALDPVLLEDGTLIGWTFRVRTAGVTGFHFVALAGLLPEHAAGPRRGSAIRALLAAHEAGADVADLPEEIRLYLSMILLEKTTEELADILHGFNVDATRVARKGGTFTVTRGGDFLGTIFDAGPNARRGRYEAWSPYALTKRNITGFFHTEEEAVESIEQAWPVPAWEVAEDTGLTVDEVLAAAAGMELRGEGRAMHRIAYATGADTKLTQAAALAIRTGLTTPPAEEPAPAEELAWSDALLLMSGTWPAAKAYQAHRADDGRLIGYTFAVGTLHSASYGWITNSGTYAKALDPYRSVSLRVLEFADQDERLTSVSDNGQRTAARDAVLAVHADAHTFRAFYRPGTNQRAGWTFRTGHGAHARYGVVTTDAKIMVGLYEYPTTAERAYHRAQENTEPVTLVDEEDARRHTSMNWSRAEEFEAHRDEHGALMGFTFGVGMPHNRRYGWVTVTGDQADALKRTRREAAELITASLEAEQRTDG